MRGELFHHLSLGQVLNRSVSLFADRFDVYMALSTAVLVPLLLLTLLISVVIGLDAIHFVAKHEITDETGEGMYEDNTLASLILYFVTHWKMILFWGILRVMLGMAITLSGEAGMVRAAADTYADQPINGWWTCLIQFGMHQLGRLWLAGLFMVLPVFGGSFLCVLWLGAALQWQSAFLLYTWILVLCAWLGIVVIWVPAVLLTIPVIVVERKGPQNAIRRSFEITQGRRCYVFCAYFILWILNVIVRQLLRNIFNADDPMSAILTPAGNFIGLIPQLVYLPMYSILTFCLYASIRVDKEGLTCSVLQRELVQPTAYIAPSTDYRQVSLMDDSGNDTIAHGLASDFA